jgi:2,3-bisphosphoglycerate-dependent phosphoglycerate mutase
MSLKWPKRIVVVRHGQSEQNVALDLLDDELLVKQKSTRDADVNLTELGILQAQQTGKFLSKTEPFDICFSSPYNRTMQTAEKIAENIGYTLKIRKDERLIEKEFGALHGHSREEIEKIFPGEFERRKLEGKYYFRPIGGENYLDVRIRNHIFLGKLHRDYPGKSVLTVTHQIPYLMIRDLFEHLGEKEILALGDVPNCGIEEFRIDTSKYPEGRMKLTMFNKAAYDISAKS